MSEETRPPGEWRMIHQFAEVAHAHQTEAAAVPAHVHLVFEMWAFPEDMDPKLMADWPTRKALGILRSRTHVELWDDAAAELMESLGSAVAQAREENAGMVDFALATELEDLLAGDPPAPEHKNLGNEDIDPQRFGGV